MADFINNYQLMDELGAGSFGTVYKAKKTDGHILAVKKLIPPENDEDHYKLMVREIEIHMTLENHPNVVKFVDWFHSSGSLHLVMEYCEQGSLDALLRKRLPDASTAMSFMMDMARGLNHLHRNGIIHRDIKPENILLVEPEIGRPRCKISDFGLSVQSTTDPTDIPEDQRGSIVGSVYHKTLAGTKPYIAPEVWKSHYTKRCDIFSLGLVFYDLFSSQSSRAITATWFSRKSKLEIDMKVRECVKDVKVANLIVSMLEKDPHVRISAYDVEDALVKMSVSDEEVFFIGFTCFLLLTIFVLVPYKLFITFLSLLMLILIEFRMFPESIFSLSY